jgi:outer membrane protein
MPYTQPIKHLVFVLAFFASWNLQAQEVIVLNLKESIDFALDNNVDSKNAKLEILASKAVIGENLARGLPQINGNFDFTYNMAIPIVFLPNQGPFANPDIDADVIPARFGVDFQSALGVRVDQMIFDGSFFVGLQASRTLKRLTEFDQKKTEIDVVENIKKAFYTALVNEERKKLVMANLNRLEQLQKETEALYREGFAEKLDVSRIKVQVNNLKSELDKINTVSLLSLDLLKLQMGLPMNYQVIIEETLQDLELDLKFKELMEMEGYQRIEIDQINTNIDLVKLNIKNFQVQYIPQINGFLTMQRSGAALDFSNVFNSSNWFTAAFMGVNMKIPVFDGFLKKNRIQQNRVQLHQLENQKNFMLDNISYELRRSKLNLTNSLKTLAVQEENKALALEVFQMTKIKYEEGVGSNLEVVEADSSLKEAESNYFSALYDALIAKVDLEKALGILK